MGPKNYAGTLGSALLGLMVAGGCIPDGTGDSGGGAFGGANVRPPDPNTSGVGGSGPFAPSQMLAGPVEIAAVRPPAVSGGTLLVLRDGVTAVASDPERDRLYIADLASERLVADVALQAGDEPGRLIEAANGEVLVALRGAGAVVRLDVKQGVLAGRAPVCGAPRGIAFQSTTGFAYVACSGGELVSVNAADLAEKGRAQLDRDLRDVVVSGNTLFVTRFRSVELLTVSTTDFKVMSRRVPPGSQTANLPLKFMGSLPNGATVPEVRSAEPRVAWRMRAMPDGSVRVIHQEASNGELGLTEGGYAGGGCGGPLGTSVAMFRGSTVPATSGGRLPLILPYDFDVSSDGKRIAMVAGGDIFSRGASRVLLSTTESLETDQGGCRALPPAPPPPTTPDEEVIEFRQPAGEATAVAFDGKGRVVVQTREPARIEILSHRGGAIKLSDDSRADTGHRVFHMQTDLGLSCASCHPEGGDDGHVWRFQKLGLRRTQNLLGGIASTAPFHWDGEMKDLSHLMKEVFTGRMRGPALKTDQVMALQGWIDKLPAIKPSPAHDLDSAERGRALFNDTKVACATCHKGALFTDNTSRVVGKGVTTQVPGLRGLAARAPFMHDGCAKTLLDRFSPACGGGDAHGVTSHLSQPQLLDLVAYLETL
jgi:mono/diheme cytochrome c family protein